MSIKDYFSDGLNVVKAQLLMQKKFGHDCLLNFFYAAAETEALGGRVIYSEDGPPTAGAPVYSRNTDFTQLVLPDPESTPCLKKVLVATSEMKKQAGDDIPIIGVVVSPFSLPVMQLGFSAYLDMIYEEPEKFDQLMEFNENFCVMWANAQIEAGANIICYFDPISSSTVVPLELYRKTGFLIAKRTIARIKSPVGTHYASGLCKNILQLVPETKTVCVGVSCQENLGELKKIAAQKITLLGNLNGTQMRTWTKEKAEEEVKKAISLAGKGGGFILSDAHGEIPFQVSDEVLGAISAAVKKWGEYPLEWVKVNEQKNVNTSL